jgi:ribonuclease HII
MTKPSFELEKALWKEGFKVVAGSDEVGRGSFAGPVVAGCVVLPAYLHLSEKVRINDSKKLTSRQREYATKWIEGNARAWGIGEARVGLINRIGIGKATKVAFRRAISSVREKLAIDFLLIDAFYIPRVRGLRRKNQKAIIHGDEKSVSIAAASIIAKVYRDKLMQTLSRKAKFKKYGWGKNKGYGTKMHQESIKKYGLTRHHREVFVRTFLKRTSSSQAQSGA